ncbi:hypothetical protein GOHSU_45_00410 [Gordonia hirsuta DSM 44140 = NBRC 16056]|uniref:Uncharacterized protein n=1 Tax=Gordonia hirsuta DSM 44140 = NBRC 16056 TaxID=1121927 RepID=L7LC18_9ACTN|nr:hypothetical protein [Gordonia hirsuta]GAC58675.1 hypothetical protein GOHSU_45_00410 [Gordonia hirsuta DSM 44140 = NBRC 16056]
MTPHAAPNRRTVLRGAAGLSVGLATGAAALACAPGPSERTLAAQALVEPARLARRQQRQAQQLAVRETAYTQALGRVAAERGAHAQALIDEINRLNAPTAADVDQTVAPLPVTLDALRDGLDQAARNSADAAAAADGFRAGLLASISASCTALREVQLA